MNIVRYKESALAEWTEMIQKSWTWDRLTDAERKRFIEHLYSIKINGTWEQRWRIINDMYSFFLLGLDYKPIGWREPDENIPKF